jgi:hypothetical protein
MRINVASVGGLFRPALDQPQDFQVIFGFGISE